MGTHLDFYKNNASIDDNLEMLEMSDSCIWILDDSLRLKSFNKVYRDHMIAFTGLTPQTGEDDIVINHFPADFADNIRSMYAKALKGEITKSFERGFQADGTRTDTIMIFRPVVDDSGAIKGVSCLRRDVSDVMALKREIEDKDQLLTEIVWQQSHLFRGPLSTAIGIANLLDDSANGSTISPEECKQLLEGLKTKLQELDNLIRKIVTTAAANNTNTAT